MTVPDRTGQVWEVTASGVVLQFVGPPRPGTIALNWYQPFLVLKRGNHFGRWFRYKEGELGRMVEIDDPRLENTSPEGRGWTRLL